MNTVNEVFIQLHLSTCSTSLIPRPGNDANAVPI